MFCKVDSLAVDKDIALFSQVIFNGMVGYNNRKISTLGIDGITTLLVLGHLVKCVLAALFGLAKGLPLLWYVHLKTKNNQCTS